MECSRFLVPVLGLLLLPIIVHANVLRPIDANATAETVALMNNLNKFAQKGFIFGHQNAEREGVGRSMQGPSDIYLVTNKNPGVVGFDFREISQYPESFWNFYLEKVKAVYERQGIITFSWHMHNPVTGGNAWDRTSALHRIVPGGDRHDAFKKKIDLFADFALSAKGSDGKLIPIIFRPFHEHTGRWFWWSAKKDQQNFIKCWKWMVDYLVKERGVHNLLFAYSPDRYMFKSGYFYAYPGDDYVDVFGQDYYTSHLENILWKLEYMVSEAKKRGKIAAITETGVEGIKHKNYWTEHILKVVKENTTLRGLSFILFWRNASDKKGHFYVPYPGHWSVYDFLVMEVDDFSLFNEDFIHSPYILIN